MISRWQQLAERAARRIWKTIRWNNARAIPRQIAEELIAAGNAENFLRCARRGRPRPGGLRAEIVGEIERIVAVPRRKPRVRAREPLPLFKLDAGAPGA